MNDELLTLKEAATLLRCHENTLRHWDKKGILTPVRIGQRGIRKYKKQDVMALLNKSVVSNDLSCGLSSEVLEQITDAFFALDMEWKFLYVNKEAESLLKKDRNQLIGTSIWKHFPDAVDTTFYREYLKVMKDRKPLKFEDYYAPFDMWFQVKAYPATNGIYVFFNDITEWKKTEEELRRAQRTALLNEARFKAVFQYAPHPMLISRLDDGRFIDVNQAFLETLGYKRDEVIGLTSKEIRFWGNYDLRQKFVESLKQTGVYPPTDMEYRNKQGELRSGILTATLVSFDNDPLIIAEIFDNETRKKIEMERLNLMEQVESERTTLVNVLEQLPEGVIIAEASSGKLLYCNQQMERIFRHPFLPSSKIKEYSQWKGFHSDGTEYKAEEWPLARTLKTGKIIREVIKILRGDGTYGFVSVTSAPIKDKHGKMLYGVVVDTDITELKETEQRKDEFISIASHELKTPVTSLKAYAQVLEKVLQKNGNENELRLIEKLDHQVGKLIRLINDLLDVNKFQSGKLQFSFDAFPVFNLVEEVVRDLQFTTDRHTLIVEGFTDAVVWGDRNRLAQVLTNLLSNAIRYSPEGGNIVVSMNNDDTHVAIRVRDNGVGIPADKKDKIFERFYRVNGEESATYPGLGLGLYIASQIVDRHNGTLTVKSTEGKGSTFILTLPLSRESLS